MKKLLFLTATRAEFGKLKPLMHAVQDLAGFETFTFVTGMHMLESFGGTYREVVKDHIRFHDHDEPFTGNVHLFLNQVAGDSHDLVLANTLIGLSRYLSDNPVDLIIVHGDRVEALAGAIAGATRNVLVAHVEGGEVSGTIDESLRHATTKMAHIHFVANQKSRDRLLQMGESADSIHVIGSPDMDVLQSDDLPDLQAVRNRYEIGFPQYAIAIFHPVTTELDQLPLHTESFVSALVESDIPYIVIQPNNDPGYKTILAGFERLKGNGNFRIIPSMRFEYFLTLLKNARFLVGNSSAGVRETTAIGVPSVNVGNRQHARSTNPNILNTSNEQQSILQAIRKAAAMRHIPPNDEFGGGQSAKLFLQALTSREFWATPVQKQFREIGQPNVPEPRKKQG